MPIGAGRALLPTTTKMIKIYPAAALAVVASTSTTAWTFGSWVQLVPASTITTDFVVIGIWSRGNTSTQYILEMGSGAAASETTEIQLGLWNTNDSAIFFPMGKDFAANTRLAVRAAFQLSGSSGDTYTRVLYIEKPF